MVNYKELDTQKVIINDKEFKLIVMTTDEEKEYGAKGIDKMDDDEGLLFDYTDDPQKELMYWMEDTSIPLDIIFISDEDEVLKVIPGEPESEEYLICRAPAGRTIKYVMEINQNSGIEQGDEVDFQDFDEKDHPELEPNKMYIIGSDGKPQAELEGGERIFSRISTRKIISAAKKAFYTKLDRDYKKLGKIVFKELTAQDSRDPEYVKSRE